MLVGALTTVFGLAGLIGRSIPGLREIGVFAAVGVLGALVATRVFGPWLVGSRAGGTASHAAAVGAASRFLTGLGERRKTIVAVCVGVTLIASLGFLRVRWLDDVRALNQIPVEMEEEAKRVRGRVAAVGAGRVVVATGPTLEDALAVNDGVYQRLRPLRDRGALALRSIHELLWSQSLQQQNIDFLQGQPRLRERTLAALEEAGFAVELFSDFLPPAVAGSEPLRFSDLEGTPLEALTRPFLLEAGEEVGLVTFLDGAQDSLSEVDEALSGLEHATVFDQARFMKEAYGGYRERLLGLLGLGALAVLGLVALRYRNLREVAASLLPAALASLATVGLLALIGTEIQILHLVASLVVFSMGVDYGVFLTEHARLGGRRAAGVMVGIVIAAVSTMLGFGLLGLSGNPALSAIGVTTALGVSLAVLLSPLSLLLIGRDRGE
jgi:predicted exporter